MLKAHTDQIGVFHNSRRALAIDRDGIGFGEYDRVRNFRRLHPFRHPIVEHLWHLQARILQQKHAAESARVATLDQPVLRGILPGIDELAGSGGEPKARQIYYKTLGLIGSEPAGAGVKRIFAVVDGGFGDESVIVFALRSSGRFARDGEFVSHNGVDETALAHIGTTEKGYLRLTIAGWIIAAKRRFQKLVKGSR